MGRPVTANKFNNVKMTKSAASKLASQNSPNNAPDGEKDVGKELNRLAGSRRAGTNDQTRFVDERDHNNMDKHAFLKLLSNQLSNQDPFKPVDQKKFAADLAQFSQLEQLANMNTKFDKVFNQAPSQQKFMGANLLGKSVLTEGTSIKVDKETSMVNLPFYLKKPAKKLMVRIYDSSNNMIQQKDIEGMGKGNQSIMWDLVSLDGTRAVNDNYRFEVTAWDETFNEFKGETRAEGKVTGVEFEGGEILLTVADGRKIFLRDVHSFSDKLSGAAKNTPLKQAATKQYNNISEQTR